MHRAMPPNLFLYWRLADPLDIALLRQSLCPAVTPGAGPAACSAGLALLRGFSLSCPSQHPEIPGCVCTNESSLCSCWRKMQRLWHQEPAEIIRSVLNSAALICAAAQAVPTLDYKLLFRDAQSHLKNSPFTREKTHPKWETGATPPSADFGSAHQHCLVLFHAGVCSETKDILFLQWETNTETWAALYFFFPFEASRNWIFCPNRCSKSLLMTLQSWCFCAHHQWSVATDFVCTGWSQFWLLLHVCHSFNLGLKKQVRNRFCPWAWWPGFLSC